MSIRVCGLTASVSLHCCICPWLCPWRLPPAPGRSARCPGLWFICVHLGTPMCLNVSAHVWVREATALQGSLCSCAHAWQCFCLCNVSRWVPMDLFMYQPGSRGSRAFTSRSPQTPVCMFVFWSPHGAICGSLHLCSRGPPACPYEAVCLNPSSRHQPQKAPASPPPPLTAMESAAQ